MSVSTDTYVILGVVMFVEYAVWGAWAAALAPKLWGRFQVGRSLAESFCETMVDRFSALPGANSSRRLKATWLLSCDTVKAFLVTRSENW